MHETCLEHVRDASEMCTRHIRASKKPHDKAAARLNEPYLQLHFSPSQLLKWRK